MATERLRVILEMVTNQYKKGAREAAQATDGITKSGDSASKSVSGLSGRLDSFRKTANVAAGAAGAAALVATFQDSVRAASDLGESVNAVEKVFGDASGQILAFSDVASEAAGLSKTAFNTLVTSTGSLLTNFGFSASAAASEATQLTVRAADLASVFNTDVEDALGAVNAALRGETEPIRRFGVSLSDAAIRAKAVELGLADTTAEVDANGKAVAALELIYEQTSSAAGDFIQTNDSLANSARQAAADWENAKASFGQAAIPIASSFLSRFSEGLLIIRSNFDGAANQALQFGRAMDAIAKAFQDGEDPTLAFQDSLLFIAENSELTTDQLLALASAAGVTVEDTDAFAESFAALAADLGASPEVIEEVVSAILGIDAASGEAAGSVGDLGDETNNAADATAKLVREQKNLGTELRKQSDPVFRAISSYTALQDALESAAEDGVVTLEEKILDLAPATIDAEEALRDLGGGNLERGIEAIALAIGESEKAVRDFLVQLGILDGQSVKVLIEGQVTGIGSIVTGNDIAESIRFGNIRNQAGRAFGGAVAAGRSYLVGERGPEFFTPNISGRISSGPLGGTSENVTINLNVTTEPGFSNQVVREMEQALSRYKAGAS